MSRRRSERATDQPMPRAIAVTEEVVGNAADMAEHYGRLLGRGVQDSFLATDHHIERVELLRIALIEASEGLHPSRSLDGLAAVLAPLIEHGMGLQ